MTRRKTKSKQTALQIMNSVKADSLTGFIAGFLVGVIGMYVYALILVNMA